MDILCFSSGLGDIHCVVPLLIFNELHISLIVNNIFTKGTSVRVKKSVHSNGFTFSTDII